MNVQCCEMHRWAKLAPRFENWSEGRKILEAWHGTFFYPAAKYRTVRAKAEVQDASSEFKIGWKIPNPLFVSD